MAYLCPVCDAPQVDADHLANHLAFTALIRGGDHEAWLDETVPGWEDNDESWLAPRLRETVDAVEHPIDGTPTHEHGDGGGHDHGRAGRPRRDPAVAVERTGELDGEAAAIVEEALELTRQMGQEAPDGDESTDEDATEDETD